MSLIRLRNIAKTYDKKQVLREVFFKLEEGDRVGLGVPTPGSAWGTFGCSGTTAGHRPHVGEDGGPDTQHQLSGEAAEPGDPTGSA